MTPLDTYTRDIEQHGFQQDDAQLKAVQSLDKLYHDFIEYVSNPVVKKTGWKRWFSKTQAQPVAPKRAVFLGRSRARKTYLMDTFFEALPCQKKMRVHFHRFMYRVHDELNSLGEVNDPLELVADKFKSEADIICFDEFFVSDITDAMILGTLFQALFRRGVVLVATSNIPPQDLYRNGLQRARFLPAIELIQANCDDAQCR